MVRFWFLIRGFWQKDTELWKNIQKSEWEDVILDADRKKALIEDVIGFFDAEDRYAEFNVPWKVCRFIHHFIMMLISV